MSRKALAVGINNYPINPLKGCENDATEIAKILSHNGDGKLNFEVKPRLNITKKAELKVLVDEFF